MRTFSITALAAAAALLFVATTAVASADTSVATYHDATSMISTYGDGGAGQYAGTLDIEIYASGVVSGWYSPQDGLPTPITGGRDGNKIWFDIGTHQTLHVTGTMAPNGAIAGQAIRGHKQSGIFDFRATPAPH